MACGTSQLVQAPRVAALVDLPWNLSHCAHLVCNVSRTKHTSGHPEISQAACWRFGGSQGGAERGAGAGARSRAPHHWPT